MADDIFDIALSVDAAAAMPGAATIVGVFRELVSVLAQARQEAQQFGDKTMQLRDSLRDIASVRGQAGVSDELIKETLDLRKKSGMTATEAHSFTEQFLGEAEAFRDKMDPKEFQRLSEQAARYAVVVGGDVGTRGKLAGRLMALAAPGTKADDIMNDMNEANRIIESGSGKAHLVTTSYTNLAATMLQPGGTGRVGSARTLAILAMAASRVGGESEVDTNVERFAKAVQGGTTSKPWREFLKGAGVKEGMKVEESMQVVFDKMEGAAQSGRDLDRYLQDMGIQRTEERRTLVAMFGQRESMNVELARRVQAKPGQETAAGRIDAGTRSREVQRRLTDAALAAKDVEYGMGQEVFGTYLKKAQIELYDQLTPEAKAAGWIENLAARAQGTTRPEVMLKQRAVQIYERENQVRLGPADETAEDVIARDEAPGAGLRQRSDMAREFLNPALAGARARMMAMNALPGVSPKTRAAARTEYISQLRSVMERERADRRAIGALDVNRDVAGEITHAESALRLGDVSQRTEMGPTGQQMTGREYGEYLHAKGLTGDQWQGEMNKFLKRLNARQAGPMMAPAPGGQPAK
jgi:hypothetical protein